MLLRCLKILLAVAPVLSICFLGTAHAHPHGWIDLRSTVILNEDGHVVAIEQEWLFDEFYSVFATDGWDMSTASGAAALTDLARGNLENLRDYDYFTEIIVDGEKQIVGDVREFETAMQGARIWMRLVVPLDSTVDPKSQSLSFSVFDPTYYLEVLHLEGDVIAFQGAGTLQCNGAIISPSPSFEAVSLAQSLPADADADDTLGRLFAERVEVTCR